MPVDPRYLCIKNNGLIRRQDIPLLNYADFSDMVVHLLSQEENHCVNYFAFSEGAHLKAVIVIADDRSDDLMISSFVLESGSGHRLQSLTPRINALHIFEREIAENHGVIFEGHPWMKPLRYAFNRADSSQLMQDYPFYTIGSHELHEVGVGPIHAGVIEPGHFRFICNGENVLHLEIQLGYQHRGIEQLMIRKENLIQRTVLAEGIAGDTTVGHTFAFAGLMEALGTLNPNERLDMERSLALELERIAMHTGDIAALCTDVAYGLGANIFGILRTGIINFTQLWCGNRLGRGMIRVGGTYTPFTQELATSLLEVLKDFENRFMELAHHTYKLSSVENRFDDIGTVTRAQMLSIGAVGMAARMAGLHRDIRVSHPYAGYLNHPIEAVVLPEGDVFSRFLLRRKEIRASLNWIRDVISTFDFETVTHPPTKEITLQADSLAVSLTEGWRGEICHCALTDKEGRLAVYKIKDPSLHNWKALELSLRNLEISDFPINNKSYNLSYCGFDL
jgi:Ni,Fe-hydrogenase III large subunit